MLSACPREDAMTRLVFLLVFVCLASAAAAEAQSPGRYVLAPVEGGALRLDTETGEVSRCAGNADAASCTPMAEVAGDDDVAALKDRVAKLEARVAALEARTTIAMPMPDEE